MFRGGPTSVSLCQEERSRQRKVGNMHGKPGTFVSGSYPYLTMLPLTAAGELDDSGWMT